MVKMIATPEPEVHDYVRCGAEECEDCARVSRLTVELRRGDHRKLKAAVAYDGTTIADMVQSLIAKYLRETLPRT